MPFTPSENPITNPTRESYTELRPFRFWCQKVLPLVYDNSLSYYELLCKVVDYLNNTMEDVDHMNTDIDTLYSSFQEFQEGTIRIYNELVAYVNAYFENLDVQEEINNKLDDMVTSGELVTILQPSIADEVASWLADHITPTTPAIDDTLTVSGAGADAKVVGDNFGGTDGLYGDIILNNGRLNKVKSRIGSRFLKATNVSEINKELNDVIEDYNSKNVLNFIDDVSFSVGGGSITYDGDTKKYTVTTAPSSNGFVNIYSEWDKFPNGINAGDDVTVIVEGNANFYYHVFFYINDSWARPKVIYDTFQFTIPANATGMLIRINVNSAVSVGDTLTKIIMLKNPSNSLLNTPSVILPSETYEQSDIINEKLAKYKSVLLLPGTHIIDASIVMPDNSSIFGVGESSILLYRSRIIGITVGANCELGSFSMISETGHTTSWSENQYAGILVEGNLEEAPFKGNTKIHDISISGFMGAGIRGRKTGYYVANSISAVNCKITNCYAGIILDTWCEFNRFTNILSYNNYIGLYCFSGNNTFSNCDFSNNSVGIYLEGNDENLSGNTGHGTIENCTINHSSNNTGYGILVKYITGNGFLFKNCQMWYSKIQVEGSSGIVIDGFEFGQDIRIESYNNSALFLMNSIFKNVPTFSVSGNAIVKRNNFTFDGTEIV